jgi:hypothetical protein
VDFGEWESELQAEWQELVLGQLMPAVLKALPDAYRKHAQAVWKAVAIDEEVRSAKSVKRAVYHQIEHMNQPLYIIK